MTRFPILTSLLGGLLLAIGLSPSFGQGKTLIHNLAIRDNNDYQLTLYGNYSDVEHWEQGIARLREAKVQWIVEGKVVKTIQVDPDDTFSDQQLEYVLPDQTRKTWKVKVRSWGWRSAKQAGDDWQLVENSPAEQTVTLTPASMRFSCVHSLSGANPPVLKVRVACSSRCQVFLDDQPATLQDNHQFVAQKTVTKPGAQKATVRVRDPLSGANKTEQLDFVNLATKLELSTQRLDLVKGEGLHWKLSTAVACNPRLVLLDLGHSSSVAAELFAGPLGPGTVAEGDWMGQALPGYPSADKQGRVRRGDYLLTTQPLEYMTVYVQGHAQLPLRVISDDRPPAYEHIEAESSNPRLNRGAWQEQHLAVSSGRRALSGSNQGFFELRFTGHLVEVLYLKYSKGYEVDVTIDGKAAGSYDCYANQGDLQPTGLWRSRRLKDGDHLLQLKPRRMEEPWCCWVDAFRLYPGPAAPTPASLAAFTRVYDLKPLGAPVTYSGELPEPEPGQSAGPALLAGLILILVLGLLTLARRRVKRKPSPEAP